MLGLDMVGELHQVTSDLFFQLATASRDLRSAARDRIAFPKKVID